MNGLLEERSACFFPIENPLVVRKSRYTPLIHDSCEERRRKEIGDLVSMNRQNGTSPGRTPPDDKAIAVSPSTERDEER